MLVSEAHSGGAYLEIGESEVIKSIFQTALVFHVPFPIGDPEEVDCFFQPQNGVVIVFHVISNLREVGRSPTNAHRYLFRHLRNVCCIEGNCVTAVSNKTHVSF